MILNPYNQTAIFYNALKLKNAEILEEDETGIMIQIHECRTVLLLQSNLKTAKSWFDKHPLCSFDLISLYGDALCDLFCQVYLAPNSRGQNDKQKLDEPAHFKLLEKPDLKNTKADCTKQTGFMKEKMATRFGFSRLFVWPENQKAEFGDFTLTFKTADLFNFSWIRSYYDLISDEELIQDLESGRIFIGCLNDQPVGFAGMHPEGSMGLLVILPEFRRQGFGMQMEQYLIQQLREHRLAACCEVFCDNSVSIALQKKLGLKEMPENCCWIALESDS